MPLSLKRMGENICHGRWRSSERLLELPFDECCLAFAFRQRNCSSQFARKKRVHANSTFLIVGSSHWTVEDIWLNSREKKPSNNSSLLKSIIEYCFCTWKVPKLLLLHLRREPETQLSSERSIVSLVSLHLQFAHRYLRSVTTVDSHICAHALCTHNHSLLTDICTNAHI